MNKLENAKSSRVAEVQELAQLLEINGMTSFGALRSAVECVYHMTERYHRHNYGTEPINREQQNDEEWERCKCDYTS